LIKPGILTDLTGVALMTVVIVSQLLARNRSKVQAKQS